ncbi:hypothetical protein AB5J62_34840 [Amycolatopsis sp. cg5]|uniref:hypothetical protein n=1 Tax=Amycolatopsis sp. cg5 TaxID=3238802 RepID=UPI0035241109
MTGVTRAGTIAGTALLLLAAACGSPAAPPPSRVPSTPPVSTAPTSTAPAVDLSTLRRAEIPADVKNDLSGLPPKPADSAPVRDKLAWEALDKVTRFAQRVDPGAKASCPAFNARSTTTATCTVTYLGENYDYVLRNIEFVGSGITDGRTERGSISYKAELPAGPIVRDELEKTLRYQAKTEYVACDMPEHQRFELAPGLRTRSSGAGPIYKTAISCRYLDPGSNTVSTRAAELNDWGSLAWPQPQ